MMIKLGELKKEKEVVKITWREFVKLNNFRLPDGRFAIKFIFLPQKFDGSIVFQVESHDKIYNVKKTIAKEEFKKMLDFIGLSRKTNFDLNRSLFIIEDGSFGIDVDENSRVFYEYKGWGWAVREYKEVVSDIIEF